MCVSFGVSGLGKFFVANESVYSWYPLRFPPKNGRKNPTGGNGEHLKFRQNVFGKDISPFLREHPHPTTPQNHTHTQLVVELGIFLKSLLRITLQGTPQNGILKMIFHFPRWDMLIPWRVYEFQIQSEDYLT